MKSKIFLLILGVCYLFTACSDDRESNNAGVDERTGGLPILVNFSDIGTKVTELPGTDAMNDDGKTELRHIGLYIYYSDDYNRNDLRYPYIKNLECRLDSDGKLEPVVDTQDGALADLIYIYDEMTIVAFYPYNAAMNDVDFVTRADEEQYPITMEDYSEQVYIPYRGTATVNPTTAFFIQIYMYPKHTFKVEIILVSDNLSDFDNPDDIKILPNLDPVDNDNPIVGNGKREQWVDRPGGADDTGGGSHYRRYTSYIWTEGKSNPIIQRNDVLFDNGNLMLLAADDVDVRETRVYRYGYNMTTGEIFIPTSERLIHDAATLHAFAGVETTAYQVCDIDVSSIGNWVPKPLLNTTYDGGGHQITGLTINSSDNEVGLFRKVVGYSSLKNINLIDPVITVNSSADSCSVGGLTGLVNSGFTQDEINILLSNLLLPENLSDVVKAALLKDLMANLLDSETHVLSCRVENPVINVTGVYPRVGGLCGVNGNRGGDNGEYTYTGIIWDSYVLGGSITVNNGDPASNDGARVAGFCGQNEYMITRCYTTMAEEDITAIQNVQTTDPDGNPVTEPQNIIQGFAWHGDKYIEARDAEITECFAMAPDYNSGVTNFADGSPGWPTYTGIWPINTSTWNDSSNSFWWKMSDTGVPYPILNWERR